MYDELTDVDIKKMEEEIAYRENELAPKLRAEMARTREYGDLSENAEYKEAKREKRRNDGRIIEVEKRDGIVGLFDIVTVYNEKANKEKKIQIVTTLRQNAMEGYVSKESPLGVAIMGKAVGERVLVQVNEKMSYYVKIVAVEHGEDNESLPISGY